MSSSDTDCIFCKIVSGVIPAKLAFQSDTVTAFYDIQPQAPTHILVIPNQHTKNFTETKDPQVQRDLWTATQTIVQKEGLENYRLVVNTGTEAGQSIFHLHLHILSGRPMLWPPG